MDTRDLDRIRFVTRRFNFLQGGLRCAVPIGLLNLAGGIGAILVGRAEVLALSLQLGLTAGSLFLMFRTKAYYQATLGVVEPEAIAAAPYQLSVFSPAGAAPRLAALRDSAGARRLTVWLILVLPLAAIVRPDRMTLTRAMALVMGAVWLASWWVEREHRLSEAHHALFGLLFLALWMFGGSSGLLLDGHSSLSGFQIVLGLSLVACGLIDHLRLMRALGPRAVSRPDAARQEARR